ncbi:MAG: sulfide/dihydroorotate dehydrogenase-like FAD/NAD-binding protein [Vicinamibacteria bacterium]|nr:sulfide/dihydroorotate dehydrogenase-like FAD/NAD-binding protein [Vicinamibacteria bacterium]
MFRILEKGLLAPRVNRYVVHAPQVARSWRAGQFVIVRPREDSERIPLTIADGSAETVTLVVQEVGKTTAVMADMQAGERLADLCGPLGVPAKIEKVGGVAVVGGGVGIAPAYPIAQAHKTFGNHVIAILGARTRELLIMEEEMRRASHETVIVTDDGSRGEKGFVTTALQRLLDLGRTIDEVVAVGPAVMMKMVAALTRDAGIPTRVSLNTIMIDGTGMCGGCRVAVGGRTKFVCVDGPEFDGHQVDFDLMMRRQAMYLDHERGTYEDYLETRRCRLDATREPSRR